MAGGTGFAEQIPRFGEGTQGNSGHFARNWMSRRRVAELPAHRTAIYLLERDTVKNVTILLLVAALTGSSASALHCQWVCARAEVSEAGASHVHHAAGHNGRDAADQSGVRIGAAEHNCDHAPSALIAVKTSVAASHTVGSPAVVPPAFFRSRTALSEAPVNDISPPGAHQVFSPGSPLPLRI